MGNVMKAKGTAFETATVNFLNERPESRRYLEAHRLPPHGAVDKGDVKLFGFSGHGVITIQNKAQKAFDLAGWVKDAKEQSAAAGTNWGVVVVKAPRKNIKDAYVVMDLETFRDMMRSLL